MRSREVHSLLRLLGRAQENPVAIRSYRSTAVSLHALEQGAVWTWQPQEPDGQERIALVFAQGSVSIDTADAGRFEPDTSDAVLLHPHRARTLTASEPTTAICVWVPWDEISEIDDHSRVLAVTVPATPLSLGLRAFAGTLVGRAIPPTLYTDYLMEKLLAEMVFGVTLETSDGDPPANREARPLDRARKLMLLRRGDPSFGVDEVARELHVSTRQLQRIFAAADSSPADELRRMRVELASELLGNSDYAPLSIEDIATYAGFGTAGALRRAFAAHGLSAPGRSRSDPGR